MKTFTEFNEAKDPFKTKELINGKYLRFGDAFNKAQIKALLKIPTFDVYMRSAVRGDIMVRRDTTFDNVYYMAQIPEQKYVLRVAITNRGKIFDWTFYKKTGNQLDIIKSWSIDD